MDQRITLLEERVAQLLRVVDELSDVVARQDRELERLGRLARVLAEREAEREALGQGAVPIDLPPHY